MRWITVRQLKSLRSFPVPPEVLEAGRKRLLIVMAEAPMLHPASGGLFTACRVAKLYAAAWKPVMAVMVVVVFATGGGAVVAAHGSLPGDRLYAVKMTAEEVRERMTLTAEQRLVVQAAHAARRLDETERLLERQGLGGAERAERVRKAMDRYEDHLFVMNEIAVKMEPDPAKPKRGKKAIKATEAMLERQAVLLESATHAEPVVAAMVIDPVEASFSLEADLQAVIPADDGGWHEDFERRRDERARKIEHSLKALEIKLEM